MKCDTPVLYRAFDAGGNLLYVGATMNPAKRLDHHHTDKHWWHDVTTVTLEHFTSHEELATAEVDAIKAEQPLHNGIHSTLNPPVWARKSRAPRGGGSIFYSELKNAWMGRIELTPSADGKRRRKTVTGKTRAIVAAKMDTLRSDLGLIVGSTPPIETSPDLCAVRVSNPGPAD